MATWLLKTDAEDYSWADLERDRSTVWDGVTNNLALKHMGLVRRGDEAFIYETGSTRAVVGVARVTSDSRPAPSGQDPRVVVFDVEPARRLPRQVSLAEIKADPAFARFDLVRIPRLSVMPVPHGLRARLLSMAGEG